MNNQMCKMSSLLRRSDVHDLKHVTDKMKLRRRLAVAAMIAMAAGNVLTLWNTREGMRQGYGDFLAFYTAGVLVRTGMAQDLYSPAQQWKIQQEVAPELQTHHGPLLFMRPPFEALLFAVFSLEPYAVSLILWTIVKLILLAAIPFLAMPGGVAAHLPRWAVFPLLLGTFPAFMDLLLGQDAILLAFLFALCFWQLRKNSEVTAGLILGLALFKFQLVVPFLVATWISGRRKVLRGFLISSLVVVAISALVVGPKNLLHYPGYLLTLSQASGIGIALESQINFRGLLALFAGPRGLSAFVPIMLAAIALLSVVGSGLAWRRAGNHLLAEGCALSLVVATVTSYYANDYDLLLLIIPLLALIGRGESLPDQTALAIQSHVKDRRARYIGLAGTILLLLTPSYWLAKQHSAECLMVLPLLAVGFALAYKLVKEGHIEHVLRKEGLPK
jgi:hypothetical protein